MLFIQGRSLTIMQPPPPPYGGQPSSPYTSPAQMQGPGMATEQQMPPEVYQLAGTYQLGTLNVLYKPTFTNPLAIIGITIGVIILDIILAAVIYNVGFIVYILFLLPIFMIVFAINRIANCN